MKQVTVGQNQLPEASGLGNLTSRSTDGNHWAQLEINQNIPLRYDDHVNKKRRRDKLLLSKESLVGLVSGKAQQEIVNQPRVREFFSDFSQRLFLISHNVYFWFSITMWEYRGSIFYFDKISKIIFWQTENIGDQVHYWSVSHERPRERWSSLCGKMLCVWGAGNELVCGLRVVGVCG